MLDEKYNEKTFHQEVTFFKVRTNLSIASYLIKVGKGESADMQRIIKDSSAYVKELT